jgi:hypothetical protein
MIRRKEMTNFSLPDAYKDFDIKWISKGGTIHMSKPNMWAQFRIDIENKSLRLMKLFEGKKCLYRA